MGLAATRRGLWLALPVAALGLGRGLWRLRLSVLRGRIWLRLSALRRLRPQCTLVSGRRRLGLVSRIARQGAPCGALRALAARVDPAVSVNRLVGGGCRSGGGCRTHGGGPAGGAPRHPGIAHGGERAANDRLGRRGQARLRGRHFLRRKQNDESGGRRQGGANKSAAHTSHFVPPVTWPTVTCPGGTSSTCRATNSTRLASAGGLNVNASAATATSVFQSLTRSVYCGAPATCLLVMMYLRGIGLAPVSTHSCQSTSGPRNARCSHVTPSITPCPVLGVHDVGRQFVVDARQQEVCPRHLDVVLVADPVDELVDRAGRVGLGKRVEVLAEQRDSLAVEHQIDVCVAAGSGDPDLVRTAQQHLAGTGELDLLQLR